MRDTLISLLKHEKPVVVEGAILGLINYIDLILNTLYDVSKNHSNKLIRDIAAEALDIKG